MNRNKCPACGLINVASDEKCRRCGASLTGDAPIERPIDEELDEEKAAKRGIGRRLLWILGATLVLLFAFFMSLLITSDRLEIHKREIAQKAVAVLEQKGFAREAFVLGHLTTYRQTDNWWNNYLGHRDAYAATNFPFEVVTLYPEFFDVAVDDNERAAILLHESYHLFGSGEEAALEGVWRNKQRLGWTGEKYNTTKVWTNTRELTMAQVPSLFLCGTDGKSDCTQ